MTLSPDQLSSANGRRNRLNKIRETLPEVTIEPANEDLKISIRKKTLAYYQFDHHGDGMISLVGFAAKVSSITSHSHRASAR